MLVIFTPVKYVIIYSENIRPESLNNFTFVNMYKNKARQHIIAEDVKFECEVLRKLMTQNKLTQQIIADIAGCDNAIINRLLSGKQKDITVIGLYHIAAYFNMKMEDFIVDIIK